VGEQFGEHMAGERRVLAAERRRRALELRRAGLTYRQVARELGFAGPSSAHKSVSVGLRAMLREPAAEVRALELERLDRLLQGVWGRAVGGDVRCVDAVLRIMQRRAALLGLDHPVTVDLRALVADATRRLGLTDEESCLLFDQMRHILAAQGR
jgi:hypothetical protein